MNDYAAAVQKQQYIGSQQAGLLNQPREIGIIDRVSGLASGLTQLKGRLESLNGRIGGGYADENALGTSAVVPSLSSQISDAEMTLRSCLSLIEEIDGRF